MIKEDIEVLIGLGILYIFILVAVDIIGTVAERAERKNKDDDNINN